jgi:hypothetical protein
MYIMIKEEYTKQIKCPHLKDSKHNATLFCHPHKFAGIWECPYGYSDTHEHDNYEIEESISEGIGFEGHFQDTEDIYVCGDCGVYIEGESPAQDRYEAMVDMQIMEARGK